MIKDLESEVVAVRHIAEETARALLRFMKMEEGDDADRKSILEILYKAQQDYHAHRCARFDEEVEDAGKVIRKQYQLMGYDYCGQEFVPKKVFEEVVEENRKLRDKLRGAEHASQKEVK